ncbi:hypothetical protein SAMN04487783_0749 [Agrococcus baldri]|uniref:Spermidine synthase n=1 Tax=Agrococcus baldri TaxID=153730 RepID=A0AA94KZ01_9MICO|nr:fused MFS/spermidine synthase [Agrococcus baldri]SFS03440.1 hypothetical protein SAMN04487783_0749 [Agrococcus baldri]
MTRRMLSSGREAVVEQDDTGWTLKVGGFAQSHIGVPGEAAKHTVMRWMHAAARELLTDRGGAAALHIGGGAATLPRLLQHDDPGMRQRVIELEPAIVQLVGELAPPPDGVELVVDDGRAALHAAAAASVSLVTIDVFDGGGVPAPFTSIECFGAARRALAPGGALMINSADAPPLTFVRTQLATLRAVFAHVGMITRGSTLAIRPGNIVLLASDAALPIEAIRSRLEPMRPRTMVVGWPRLERFVADTQPAPVSDATAIPYAEPLLSRFSAPGVVPASLTAPLP